MKAARQHIKELGEENAAIACINMNQCVSSFERQRNSLQPYLASPRNLLWAREELELERQQRRTEDFEQSKLRLVNLKK